MGQKFPALTATLTSFIAEQKIFFVSTAPIEGRINLSPKGMESFKTLGPNQALWLNVTGSSNETAAHLLESNRMTVMFCAFEGKPRILRLYGTARAIHPRDKEWAELLEHFPGQIAPRQIFLFDFDLVQSSCGMSVPFYEYQGEREELNRWATKKGEQGIHDYWEKSNSLSIDGKKTGIFED